MGAGNPNVAEAGRNTRFNSENQPANPGNKKGNKHLSTHIQEMLNDPNFEANILDPKIGLREYKGAPVKAIIQVALTKAVNGDTKWADILFKYGYGQKLELANNPDNPIGGQYDPAVATEFAAYLLNKTKNEENSS